MQPLVCYIPSFNDSDFVRESVESLVDWDVVVSDNASEPRHREALDALAGPRVRVVRHEQSLGRIGNWRFCVDDFLRSGHRWMKLMMAGNLNKPQGADVYRRAIEQFPEARFIVANVENIAPDRRLIWATIDRAFLMPSSRAVAEVAQQGNLFHSLSAVVIHVEALREGYGFGDPPLSYCADLYFLMHVAKKNQVLFTPEIATEFIIDRRKTYKTGQYGLEHLLEEGLMRLRGADAYLELSGDRQGRERLVQQITQWVCDCVHPAQ